MVLWPVCISFCFMCKISFLIKIPRQVVIPTTQLLVIFYTFQANVFLRAWVVFTWSPVFNGRLVWSCWPAVPNFRPTCHHSEACFSDPVYYTKGFIVLIQGFWSLHQQRDNVLDSALRLRIFESMFAFSVLLSRQIWECLPVADDLQILIYLTIRQNIVCSSDFVHQYSCLVISVFNMDFLGF